MQKRGQMRKIASHQLPDANFFRLAFVFSASVSKALRTAEEAKKFFQAETFPIGSDS